MKHKPIQKILLAKEKNKHLMSVWITIQNLLLVSGSIMVVYQLFKNTAWSWSSVICMAILTFLCLNLSELFKERWRPIVFINALPWIILVIWHGITAYWRGMIGWLNLMHMSWNQLHESRVTLFNVNVSMQDLIAFAMLATVVQIFVVWWFVKGHHCLLVGICVCAYMVSQLLGGYYSSMACALLLSGLTTMIISDKGNLPTRRQLVWTVLICAGICISGIAQGEMESVKNAYDQTVDQIHIWRFGEKSLPEGDLSQADMLLASSEVMLEVQTEQEKTTYLKGYTGGRYVDGQWLPLADAAYRGDYDGMFDWLSERDFNPVTQTADYYLLGDSVNIPDANHLDIHVVNAERSYAYVPSSMGTVLDGKIKPQKDEGMVSKGLIGEKNYAFIEISGTKPSELMVVDSWVKNPQTKVQKNYVEAEAVYRNFVYDTYTSVDEELYPLINTMFWDGYQSDIDGIYSAVERIRKVLTENVYYVQYPESAPEGEDAIAWFLTQSHAGNSMLYSSAAVEAFRAHGIPARYAEGYYVSSRMIAEASGKPVMVNGNHAHAWVEVYFDGIGWMPVDVTPGYYFDAKTLQNMVSSPDTVHKTAALQDSSTQGQQMLNSGKNQNGFSEMPMIIFKNMGWILLGIAALCLIVLTIAFIVLECLRHVIFWKEHTSFLKADDQTRIQMMEYWVFYMLGFWGIESVLGWQTKETDQRVCERFKNIEAGEYTRITKLLEKMVYGGMMPEAYEKRTLEHFLEKLASYENTNHIWKKIKLHYVIVWASFFRKTKCVS